MISGGEYRESLRRYSPRVFVDGRAIASVADAPTLQPGINALAVTYDFALDAGQIAADDRRADSQRRTVNRMLHINESAGDLLNKLEAVRILCQETGCAQRYLAHDALNAIHQASARIDDARGSSEHRARFAAYLETCRTSDLSLGIAMTDAKGDRSLRPHQQANPDTYVHIVERQAAGIVISGTKAIVTGAPYMHEFLVMPSRNMGRPTPISPSAAPARRCTGTDDRRPPGRPPRREAGTRCRPSFRAATDNRPRSSFSTASSSPGSGCSSPASGSIPASLTYHYATHHRHSCIAARAGFGDLLIGAGALMCEANGFDPGRKASLREPMVELIKITEGFFACGVAASVYGAADPHSAAASCPSRCSPTSASCCSRPRSTTCTGWRTKSRAD
jgi:4-hydroxybutyryl-CoA dehydratase/vinylacetyl-CoA-Delta-isomerase